MMDITNVSHLLIGITGLLICFFGYKILKVVITTIGFVAGACAAGSLAHELSDGNVLVTVLSSFIGGFICSALAHGFYYIGIFSLGAFVGFSFGMMFTSEVVFLAIAAIAAGVVTLLMQKFMLVIATAGAGAWTAVLSFYLLSHNSGLERRFFYPEEICYWYSNNQMLLIATAVVALLGMIFQFNRRRKDESSS